MIKPPWFLYPLLLIVYDPERMESPKQLILFQAIIIPFPVQKGFKDKHAARFETVLNQEEEASVQESNIGDEIISVLWVIPGVEIRTDDVDVRVLCFQSVSGDR